ncbi:MAG: 50S ribosomal protein L13 [archaeon]|nr:50S ribosomal protein L13 [Nanoarchaeota archaeon]
MLVYNGEGMLLGRLGSIVAKLALLGEEIRIVNCDKVIISGNKRKIFVHEKERLDRKGYPLKSAKNPRLADRFVRRRIRGMLPWDTTRGREAYKRIMCHVGVPENLQSEKLLTLEKASIKKLPNLKYVTVGDIVKQLGGKL